MKQVFSRIVILGLFIVQIPGTALADLNDKELFALNPNSPTELRMQVRGQRHRTLYRTEYYEDTCTRTESRIATRTECTPIYEEQCFDTTREECTETSREECYETTREVCRDTSREECSTETVCRDVMREVCNSTGCHSFPTRECTNERVCRTVPGRECQSFPTRECRQVPERSCHSVPHRECRQVHVGNDCREVEYTEYYEVEYACTKSREVPIGTELAEDMVADVLVRVEGDLSQLTGKDQFRLSIANGLDVGGPDLSIAMTKNADTHLFQLVLLNQDKKHLGSKQSEIQATYILKVIAMSDVMKERTLVGGISVSKTSMNFTTSGRKLDESSKIHITIKKDKFVGGLKTIIDRDVAFSELQIQSSASGERASIDYIVLGEEKLNGRPHEFTVSILNDVGRNLGGNILNPTTIEKYRSKFNSTKKVRVNL